MPAIFGKTSGSEEDLHWMHQQVKHRGSDALTVQFQQAIAVGFSPSPHEKVTVESAGIFQKDATIVAVAGVVRNEQGSTLNVEKVFDLYQEEKQRFIQ